jgi:hypothetical protein
MGAPSSSPRSLWSTVIAGAAPHAARRNHGVNYDSHKNVDNFGRLIPVEDRQPAKQGSASPVIITKSCAQCKREFEVPYSNRARKYCCKPCSDDAKRLQPVMVN